MYEVRPMTKDDLDECSSLSKAVRVDSWNSIEKSFYPEDKFEEELLLYSPESLSKFIGSQERFAYVAADEGEICGCVIGKVDASVGIADIGWICVSSNKRGKGIAGKLIDAVSAKAVESGCHKAIAFTMRDLPDANAMYRRYGFEKEGDFRRHWMKIDFVQYGKQL